MADNILRLKVESSEYDAKLKKAAEGIRHLAEVAHQGGGELTGLEKAELDYVKALGEMETKSRTAAGSVRELESTYKELKVIYDQLNDVEKADEGGKALAASLEQIKTRAQEARAQLDNASKSLSDNGQEAQQSSGALDALASKFTINIDALKVFDMGLKAAGVALDVAKDAFFNNEEQLDEWGRIVESSQSLYEGFLNALNTGDISGFLTNIGRIEQAARDAYDALDALGTYNAFNQINIERTRTNMTESIAEFRGGKGTKEGVKAAGEAYKKELADRQRLEQEAYIAAVKEMAAKRGANAKDLMDALSGTYGHYQDLKNVQPSGTRTRYIPGLPGQAGRYEEFKVAQNDQERLGEALRHLNDTELQSLQALGAQAQRTGTEIAQVDKQLTRVLNAKQPGTGGTGGKSTKTITEEKDDFTEIIGLIGMAEERVSDLQKRIKEAPDETTITVLRDQLKEAQAELDRLNGKELDLDKIFPDQTPQSFGSSLSRGDQMAQQIKANIGFAVQEADMNTLRTLMETTIKNGIEGIDIPSDMLIEQIMGEGLDIPDTYWKELEDQINEKLKELGVDPISLDLNTGKSSSKGKNTDKTIEKMSKGISGLNNVLGGVEKMGLQIPAEIQSLMGVIEGAMMIIQGVSTIIGVTQTTATTANTVALTALTAAVWANTASSFIPFATGGIVPHAAGGYFVGGTHFSGDVTPIMANAGELVLNKAQQGNLASQLQGGGMQNLNLTATIKGEQIRLALNNNGRRTGRGEYVQSRNVR